MTSNSGKTGKLYLVGLGPGLGEYLTPAARAAISASDSVVGFRAYLQGYSDESAGMLAGKEIVAMELGQELERASAAVDLAYAGKTVSVVSSGDAGIYGMAGPVFRVLTDRGWDGENPPVVTVPGVSAMQAAAAVLGSPLMQDFCAISLSNLLTPWEKIRARLEAAAQGDFVVALYNPRSRKRQTQLLEAREILLKHRPGETPVGIVSDALRDGQRVKITDLEHLQQEAESVDMVTIVVIGNSTTYLHGGKVITPRGYEEKASKKPVG